MRKLLGGAACPNIRALCGAIAQLGERYNGIVEVGSSILPGSTTHLSRSERCRSICRPGMLLTFRKAKCAGHSLSRLYPFNGG